MESLAFLLLIFAVGYFVLIRPQQKRQQQRLQLLAQLSPGDDVITIGGLHGRIDTLTETTVDLVIAEDATGDPVLLRFDRQAIARVVAPLPDTPDDDVAETTGHDDVLADED